VGFPSNRCGFKEAVVLLSKLDRMSFGMEVQIPPPLLPKVKQTQNQNNYFPGRASRRGVDSAIGAIRTLKQKILVILCNQLPGGENITWVE